MFNYLGYDLILFSLKVLKDLFIRLVFELLLWKWNQNRTHTTYIFLCKLQVFQNESLREKQQKLANAIAISILLLLLFYCFLKKLLTAIYPAFLKLILLALTLPFAKSLYKAGLSCWIMEL